MLMQAGGNSKSVKCIYVAPTKVRSASAWNVTADGTMVLIGWSLVVGALL